MIVTCDQCETSFQLDESRIPATGARVRCSRCKHAFFLANPSASQAQVADSIAAEAAQAPGVAPEPTDDLNADTWDGLNGDSPSLAGATHAVDPEPAAAQPSPVDDEEDWEFTEEIRTEGDDLDGGLGDDLDAELSADFAEGFDEAALGTDRATGPEGAEAVSVAAPAEAVEALSDPSGGFDADALSMDTDAGRLDLEGSGEPEIAAAAAADPGVDSGLDLGGPDPAPVGEEPGHDESSFGSVDDFSSLMEDEDAAGDVASQLGSELAAELAADVAGESIGTYSERGQTDDLGDPESWDLVGGDNRVAAAAGRGPVGAQALVSALDAASADEFFSDGAGEQVATADLASMTRSFARGPVGRIGRAVGWVAALAAIAFVGQLAFQAETGRWSEGPVAVSAGPIAARTVDGGWLRTTRAGAVLRLVGEVENNSGDAVSPGNVQVVLLDAEGERILSPAIAGGFPLAPRVLRESEGAVLLEHAAAAARRFAATPIAPREKRAFEVLMLQERMPEEAVRFDLEIASGQRPVAPAPAPGIVDSTGAADAAASRETEDGVPSAQLAESPSLP